MNKGKATMALLFFVVVFAVAGCGLFDRSPENEVIIGYTGPLSGVAAEYGMDCYNGVRMAVEEINDAGGITVEGIRYSLKLVELDDMAHPEHAVDNAKELRDAGAPVIFNPVYTSIQPMLEINLEEDKEFLIMGYSSTPAELWTDNDLVVWIPPPFNVYVMSLSKMAWDEGWRRGAMVVTTGAYGEAWRDNFGKYWTGIGGEITADVPINYYDVYDFDEELNTVLKTKPDFLLIGGPSEYTALVLYITREMGYEGGIILIDQAKMDYIGYLLEDAGMFHMMENVMGVSAVSEVPNPVIKDITERYLDRFSDRLLVKVNSWEAMFHYNSVYLLARAMEAAGTAEDPYAIRAAMPDVFPLLGDQFAAEWFGISDSGRIHVPGSVQVIKDGKYQLPVLQVFWGDSEAVLEEARAVSKSGEVQWVWLPFP